MFERSQESKSIFLSHPRNPSRICVLSGTRMVHEDALYLIVHFRRSRATLDPTLHQARVKTRVSRVETLLCFLETQSMEFGPGCERKKLQMFKVYPCRVLNHDMMK